MTKRYIYDLFDRGDASRGDTSRVNTAQPGGSPTSSVASSTRASSASPAQPPPASRPPSRSAPSKKPLTVTQAVRAIRRQLESSFTQIWVEGELSNLQRPGSGHWYFTLKDDRSQLPAVMFARDNRRLNFAIKPGLSVIARGRVTYYEPGGRTQMIVSELEPAGVGARALALRQLAQRLSKEGLFAKERKKPLPVLPRQLGVVTSPTGAALRDIVKVVGNRFQQMPILLSPTRVQGERADWQIARALKRLDGSGLCDVIILGRGGGSAEDLEVFSSEVVVRAVASCNTPVVSAVGHEIDTAICDLAADVRAATPSAAAEIVVPERQTVYSALQNPVDRAARLLKRRLTSQRMRLQSLRGALSDPTLLVLTRRQDIDRLVQRAARSLRTTNNQHRLRLKKLTAGLEQQSPARKAARQRAALELLSMRQRTALQKRLTASRSRLQSVVSKLDALSPLAVLGRGYSVCLHRGQAVLESQQLQPGDRLDVRFGRGSAEAVVETTSGGE